MTLVQLERTLRGPFGVDLCLSCRAFWFDAGEQFRLTPPATLALLKRLADGPPPARRPMGQRVPCPRCSAILGRTHDLVANTQVQFLRCPSKHGIFIGLADFLRSQGLVRGLSPYEMQQLRENLTSVTCSSCGGAVPMSDQMACPFCGAAVSVVDTDHLTAALRQLDAEARAGAPRPPAVTPLPTAEVVERWRAERPPPPDDDLPTIFGRRWGRDVDLVEAGLALLSGVLFRN
jgi:hypothetical protein